jgi:hypothetical protein
MLWRVTVSPYALAASGTLTLALTVSKRFIVHFLLELFGFFILVSYTEKMPGSLKMRRFWDLEEAERVKIAKMQLRPDYGTVICVR